MSQYTYYGNYFQQNIRCSKKNIDLLQLKYLIPLELAMHRIVLKEHKASRNKNAVVNMLFDSKVSEALSYVLILLTNLHGHFAPGVDIISVSSESDTGRVIFSGTSQASSSYYCINNW
ncbi:3354_t:CDS:2 [Entrophospora sp. SA101]|nr:3354_t:CDS:2 [Entrophospora sp. SA101]